MGALFVWLTNGAGDSILIAILAHTGLNVAFYLVPSSTTRDVAALVVVAAAATAVIAATKGRLRFTGAGGGSPAPRGQIRRSTVRFPGPQPSGGPAAWSKKPSSRHIAVR